MVNFAEVAWVVVILQFPKRSDDARHRVPYEVWSLKPPTNKQEQYQRATNGAKFIDSETDCGYTAIYDKLKKAGFKAVRGSREETSRRRRKDGREEPITRVRFDLAHPEYAGEVDPQDEVLYYSAFRGCCEVAGWMTSAYENHFYLNGEEVPGCCCLSINAIGPQWLVEPDGTPVMVWQSKSAKHSGEGKVPRQPASSLDVVDGKVNVL